ncbi:MAG: DUF1127 domain-containing protein [Shimia sp.]
MAHTALHTVHLQQPTRGPILGLLLRGVALARSRRALARLDAARLADLGLDAAAARAEAARPAWDVPAAWTIRCLPR